MKKYDLAARLDEFLTAVRSEDELTKRTLDKYRRDIQKLIDYLDPAVTRVSQPTEEIGILAVKILTESIAGNEAGDAQILIPPKLIVCNSVSRLAVHEK